MTQTPRNPAREKIARDLLREKKTKERKEQPEPKKIKVSITLYNELGIEHLEHRNGKREIYGTDHTDGGTSSERR
jgi:hypothetical protein